VDAVTSLASFTSERDPWTTPEARQVALSVLKSCFDRDDVGGLWPVLEDVLKSRIKPLFAKTKNPAITAAGRKNFHPMPQPRFDMAAMDPETKPWKFDDVYATTVLEWVLSRYLVRSGFIIPFSFLLDSSSYQSVVELFSPANL
jgi:hypothetical protein